MTHNDIDFNASLMCCECNGGTTNNRYEIDGITCVDTDDGVTNSQGNTCLSYWGIEQECPTLNDKDFNASVMCCACNGGTTGNPYANGDETCSDTDNGAENAEGNTCLYYWNEEQSCSTLDDADFNAVEMCCACAGSVTYTVHEEAKDWISA